MRHGHAMVPGVIRRAWRGDDEQERVMADVVHEFEQALSHEDAGWHKIQHAREIGIPDPEICRRANISRATLNRKLGPRPGHGSAAPTPFGP